MIRSILFWIKKVNIIKSVYYSLKFKGTVICGKCNITIRGGGRICVEKGAKLLIGVNYSYPVPTVLDIYNGVLNIKGIVSINRGCKIRISQGATLEIGNGTFINEGAKIYCEEGIKIGKNCAIAFDAKLLDTDIHKIYRNGEQINKNSKIIIGDKVWIGANSIALKGTTIETNTIIGANSLVRGKCNSNMIFAGIPASVVSEYDNWII